MADDPLIQARLAVDVNGHEQDVYARDIAKIGIIETYEGASYSIRPKNVGTLILTTSSSAVSVLVNSGAYTTGSQISFGQMGTGQVTFVEGAGVAIRTPETLKLAKQYASGTLTKTDVTDEWLLAGYLEAA